MENEKQTGDAPKAKFSLAQRLVAVIILIIGIGAMVWRLIWPFTGLQTDMIFFGAFLLGAILAKAFKII